MCHSRDSPSQIPDLCVFKDVFPTVGNFVFQTVRSPTVRDTVTLTRARKHTQSFRKAYLLVTL